MAKASTLDKLVKGFVFDNHNYLEHILRPLTIEELDFFKGYSSKELSSNLIVENGMSEITFLADDTDLQGSLEVYFFESDFDNDWYCVEYNNKLYGKLCVSDVGTKAGKFRYADSSVQLCVAQAISEGSVTRINVLIYVHKKYKRGYRPSEKSSANSAEFPIEFQVTSDKVLKKYKGNLQEVTIPTGIVRIDNHAFYKQKVKKVIIPDTVTSIGDAAFAQCVHLSKISIPDSVKEIGARAFQGCKRLHTIDLPSELLCISENMFEECVRLAYVKFPDGIKEIKDRAFGWCEQLTRLVLPNSIEKISNYAFCCCENLVSINIPPTVTKIENRAFFRCRALSEITISDGVTSIGKEAFAVFAYFHSKEVIIPKSVQFMGEDAFALWDAKFCCEAESPPSGWDANWNRHKCLVVWGYKKDAQ